VYPLTLALMIAGPEAREEVKSVLRELQARIVLEESNPANWTGFLSQVEEQRPDVVVLDLASFQQPWDELIQSLKTASAPPMVVALHNSADPETILGAIRSGANEYVYPPYPGNLRKALERVSQNWVRQRSESGAQGRTVGFFSSKGGCGATTIACQLSVVLQRMTKQRVLLADFDTTLGMVSFQMRTKSRYSILDALHNTHRLDASYWKALVSNGVPGLDVIPAPAAHEFGENPPPEKFRHVLRFARLHYDWILVDLGRNLTLASLSLLEDIEEAFLISTAEVPALYQVKRAAETLLSFGFSQDRLRLVLNRVPKNLDLSPGELESMLGLPVYAMLPEDYDALYGAYGAGQFLPPASALGKQLQRLSSKMTGFMEEKAKKKFLIFG
jgi:pilus assembly protein CpaE